MAVHHAHGVGTRLALDGQSDGGLAIQGGLALERLQAVFHLGHIAQPHRVATFGC